MMISIQVIGAAAALAGLSVVAPPSGRMLLVPVTGGDANAVARIALAGGAAVLGAGPFSGSLVVVGNRAAIARRIGSWRVVIIAAPPAGCGDAQAGSARA